MSQSPIDKNELKLQCSAQIQISHRVSNRCGTWLLNAIRTRARCSAGVAEQRHLATRAKHRRCAVAPPLDLSSKTHCPFACCSLDLCRTFAIRGEQWTKGQQKPIFELRNVAWARHAPIAVPPYIYTYQIAILIANVAICCKFSVTGESKGFVCVVVDR